MSAVASTLQPPACNTGANPPARAGTLSWDWYQATITHASEATHHGVMRAVGARFADSRWKPVRPLYGYASAMGLEGVPVGSVTVLWGGNSGVHVQGTSSAAEAVANVVREFWPDHLVSRADVAYDVVEPGSFERLWRRVHGLARDGAASGGRKVSTSTEGDWLDGENGRTFYAGGRASRLRVRVYEKGHEQRARDPLCGASLDWTRCEWQLRPTSDQKGWLARATRLDALGLTPFGAAVAAAVVGEAVEPAGAVLRFASQDPAYWMAKQYRRVVLELLALDPVDMRDRLVSLVEQAAPLR